jgi:hypothetical protein
VGRPEERDHLEDEDLKGSVLIKLIYRKCDEGSWTGLIWLGIGRGGGLL